MLGHVHIVLRDLIRERCGKKMWLKIELELSLTEGFFEKTTDYPDSDTMKFIETTAYEMGTSCNEMLESLDFVWENGWQTLLKSIAYDVMGFLNAVTSLHMFINSIGFQNKIVKSPSFYCEQTKDGSLLMHYYSCRPNLEFLVKGIICRASKILFNVDVHVQLNNKIQEKIGSSQILHHCTFTIQTVERGKSLSIAQIAPKHQSPPEHPILNLSDFIQMFPTHLCFNRHMLIEHCGSFISKELNITTQPTKINDIIQIVKPNTQLSFKSIISHMNTAFVVSIKKTLQRHEKSNRTSKNIYLKGQMMLLQGGDNILFLNSIHFETIHELIDNEVYLNDYALHDNVRSVILLNQSRACQQLLNNRLEVTNENLKTMANELTQRKEMAEHLMYDSIPLCVATSLKNQERIEPEEFKEVSQLFCEIAYFSIINSQCDPSQLISLVGNIFGVYEALIIKCNCYKILSCMDSYFIICGAPTPQREHGSHISNLALGLMYEAKRILVPKLNIPILLKIGIHSGDIKVGIVGSSKLRYGVFGESVCIARRLCGIAVPGRILVSASTKLAAVKGVSDEFDYTVNGYVNVGTKNQLATYYLEKNTKKSIYRVVGDDSVILTGDGYDKLNSVTDMKSWLTAEINIKRQKTVINAMRGKNLASLASASEKLKSIKDNWKYKLNNNTSAYSGLSTGGICSQSKVCNIM